MAPNPIHLLLLLYASSLISSSVAQLQPSDEAFTSITVSQKGLEFIKDVLVTKAVSSAIPLKLPRIEKSVRIPFLGNVDMVLSNITIYEIGVPDSYVKLGDEGVAIIASGTTCNLSMNWRYSYSSWLVPVAVSDQGHASVKVEGMEIGLTLGMENYEGSLNLSLLDGGCLVRDISIKVDGGASWLYQGMIDAFQAQISSAVENAITKKLEEGIVKLNNFVQALPKEIPVDDTASVNVTFVNDPLFSNSSMGFEINGLFTTNQKNQVPKHKYENYQLLHLCEDPPKMVGISLAEDVFNSASSLYYDAEFMRWVVDKIPDKSLLNTAGWRFIIPQLYKKYPNDDMEMNISLSSPPIIKISEKDIDATVYADFILDVIHSDEVIPVACISLVIRGSGSVKIVQNNLAGSLKLNDFSMSLKWSNIGNLRIFLIQPVIWTVIETCMPYVNSHLAKGFPLPIVHGFTLENAEITTSESRITVCSDVSYAEAEAKADYLRQFPMFAKV